MSLLFNLLCVSIYAAFAVFVVWTAIQQARTADTPLLSLDGSHPGVDHDR